MEALRLLVAESNEIVRKGLCAIAREQSGWEVIAETHDGKEALKIAKRMKPDVAIIDAGMRFLSGLEVTRQIAKDGLKTRVLMLALSDSDLLLTEALEAGVRGYLVKSDSSENVISAVEALRSGRTFFTARVSGMVLDGYRQSLKKKTLIGGGKTGLTVREKEVLQLVADGLSSKQVGVSLNISIKTVDTHRANIMNKIDCHTVSALVRYAIRNNMIVA